MCAYNVIYYTVWHITVGWCKQIPERNTYKTQYQDAHYENPYPLQYLLSIGLYLAHINFEHINLICSTWLRLIRHLDQALSRFLFIRDVTHTKYRVLELKVLA